MQIYPAFLQVIQRLLPVSISVFVFSSVLLSDAYAQENSNEPRAINTLISAVKNREEALAPEKLFLHFDKPYYTTGDTIWYKAYLLNAHLEASDKSGLIYLEFVNERDSVMYRSRVPVVNGLTNGNLHLDKYPEGNYTLHAYTRWMRNFSENTIFKKQFYISSINPKHWLVNYKAVLSKTPERNLRLSLGFNSLNNQPLGFRELQLRVLAGKKELIRSKLETSADGLLDVNFKIPETKESISVIAKDLRKGEGEQVVTIPLTINRAENTDVQFMPEGGRLVAGIESKIGFKAVNEAGKGVTIEGNIYDSSNRLITSFKSLHAGMGTFTLLPVANQTYTAKVKLQDSVVKNYPLPAVSGTGTVISVSSSNDTLDVNVSGDSGSSYYLIGQSRGLICYAARFVLKEKQRNFKIPKDVFPAGITHLVLLNANYQPLNERLVFIKGSDELMVKISTDQQSYKLRDSIALTITAKDYQQQPIAGSFSLAVTDDSLIKPDSLFTHNIITNMLLTSELKGEVEYPGYYFQKNKHRELDALLLTQGWISYKWEDVFKPLPSLAFATEKEFEVKGRVTNISKKPVIDAPVSIVNNWPYIKKEVKTDQNGSFIFKDFPRLDTVMLHVKALNKNNKSFNVGVEVEEFVPPVFVQRQQPIVPWYVNADNTFLNATKAIIKQRTDPRVKSKYELDEVIIKGKKIVKGSKNLNGDGVADQILDENDLNKANKMTLLEVLHKEIKGFRVGTKKGYGQDYMIYEKVAHLVFDGIRIDDMYYPAGFELNEHYNYTKTYMDYYTAEDIRGIEILYNFNKVYAAKITRDDYTYNKDTQGEGKMIFGADNQAQAYIEITTRSGHGPNLKVPPGTYLYKPMPFAWPKEFYRPKYAVNKNSTEPDRRSTIHWEPNVITDTTGKRVVSFYAADKPGSYTVTLQGADLSGKLAFITKKIIIGDVSGQTNLSQPENVSTLISAVKNREQALAPEKLFLHFDKPYYSAGDTIWYKAYLLNAHLEASDKSGLMYLEMINEKDSVMYRRMVPVINGLTNGNLHLDNYPEGNYTLRAYTNWMRNFSENYIFKKQFYISSINSNHWLVNYKAGSPQLPANNLRVSFGFKTLNNQPVGLRELQLRVLAGKKELVRDKVQTSVDGSLDINFNVPESKERITVIAKDLRKGNGEQIVTIPITVNRIENIDVQFMPEGGNLISGIECNVGFKAINEQGKGLRVEGGLYDSANQLLVSFKSNHNGIGIFKLLPKAGSTYVARVALPGGSPKSYTLPQVLSAGTTLHVQNLRDSLRVKIQVSSGIDSLNSLFYLVGQSRGLVCYAAKTYLKQQGHVFTILKDLFPSGVTHIVLLNHSYQPLNERLVYIKGEDELAINLSTDKQTYSTRDSISLQVSVQDLEKEPVSGSFSLAVTNDAYVKPDSLYASNLISSMLLTSELKGEVDYPGYYLQDNKQEELDALLLTQGWVAYDWGNLFKPIPKPLFDAERELAIKGRVLNVFNKSLSNVSVALASHWPPIKKDTRTDSVGTFVFKDFPALDSAMFHLKALNKNGNSFNLGIKVDEFVPPVFEKRPPAMPWYVNADTTVLKAATSLAKQWQAYEKITGANVLKEVIIKGRKIVKGSKNLNGPGNADFVLDGADMLKAKKMTLLQLLESRLPGFRNTGYSMTIKNRGIMVIIDGMSMEECGLSPKEMFRLLTAEDIKGIELVVSKNMEYFRKYADPTGSPGVIAFLEITTMKGTGPFFKILPGTYFYRPMPFAWPKQFYRPRYTFKSTFTLPDIRSTIHWEPNIVTDAAGKKVLSFYAADKPGNYTLTLQGVDMSGKLGFITKKITIK